MAVKKSVKKTQYVFLIPYDNFFKIVFIFGDKAIDAISKSDVDDNLKRTVIQANKYAGAEVWQLK